MNNSIFRLMYAFTINICISILLIYLSAPIKDAEFQDKAAIFKSPVSQVISPSIHFQKAEETKSREILFDGKNVSKWKGLNTDSFPSDIWKVKNGLLYVDGKRTGGDIITRETFKNFDLEFDFKLTYAANSGIKYLVNNIRNNESGKMVWNGPEYQIIDDFNNPDIEGDSGSTASLYLVYAPDKAKRLNPAGKWNHGKIVVNGNHIEHWLNGVKVVSCERGSEDYRERIGRTKFKAYTHYGETESGHIMLTDHGGDKVYFKKIRIRRL